MNEFNQATSEIVLATFDEGRVREAAEGMRERLGGAPDCVFVFASPDYRPHLQDLLEVIQVYGHAAKVFGCSGWGLIGTGQEDENTSGFTLMALRLPHTEIAVAKLRQEDVENAGGEEYWPRKLGLGERDPAGWVLLGNPFEMDHEALLRAFNTTCPGQPVYGGLASGRGGEADAFLLDSTGGDAASSLAVSFEGGVKLGGLVSQGCRPIGEPYLVTKADANLLFGIGSRGAYQVLEETFEALSVEEQAIARQNMLVGLAMSEYGDSHGTGDFLVRGILGGDPDAGALALGAFPRVGQTVQFQMRDSDAADAELRRLCLEQIAAEGEPFGGLLFSCAGRGSQLFGVPNHDAGTVEEVFGQVPLAGFFCNGEVGPVGGTNFLHGYTASLALFYNA